MLKLRNSSYLSPGVAQALEEPRAGVVALKEGKQRSEGGDGIAGRQVPHAPLEDLRIQSGWES